MKLRSHINRVNIERLQNVFCRFQYFMCDGFSIHDSQRTPMSMLDSTPITPVSVSSKCHLTFKWPVTSAAIAEKVFRPLPLEAGLFKLQLQRSACSRVVISIARRWSCNLKSFKFTYRTPMSMLHSPLHWQHRRTAAHRCLSYSSSKCWKILPTPTPGVGSFKEAFL